MNFTSLVNSTQSDSEETSENLFIKRIKFVLFISFQIPSILCHLFLIYHLLTNRTLRETLRNHIILCLLIINFCLITFDLSITLDFLYYGYIRENTWKTCQTWNFLDSFLSNLCSFFMMWASLERHILIFHSRQLHNTQFKRLLFHYCPLIIILIYTLVFYIIAVFFHPTCSNETHFHTDVMFCGKACYVHNDIILSAFDLIVHKILSSFLIFFFSFTLLIRVIMKVIEGHHPIRWHRRKKMIIQFLLVSFMYFIGTLPSSFSELLHILSNHPHDGHETEVQEDVFLYLFYLTSLILPFLCLLTVPEILTKLSVLFHFTRPNDMRIQPINARQNRLPIIQ